MKVGFIGLGIMGKPMSKNLLKAGYELVVFDFNKDAVNEVVGCGAVAANNGKEVAEYVDPRESLLEMLRNRLGLTSVKKGCEVGECGACTVIIDGETIDSCIYLAVWAEGKNIRTLEGLEKNGELTRIQEAFIEEGAVQCGFCTPGFIMSATVLLERGEVLSREAIKKQMSGNLCRCTGYQNIVNAVEKVMKENADQK